MYTKLTVLGLLLLGTSYATVAAQETQSTNKSILINIKKNLVKGNLKNKSDALAQDLITKQGMTLGNQTFYFIFLFK